MSITVRTRIVSLVVNTMHNVKTSSAKPSAPSRKEVFLLAAIAGCHAHTARRALIEGPDAIKGDDLRERLARGIAQLAHVEARTG